MKSLHSLFQKNGFSLIELLTVVAIALILMAILIPSIGGVTANLDLTRQGQLLHDTLAFARQLSSTKNQSHEVRLYQPQTTNEGWRYQIWAYQPSPSGGALIPEAVSKRSEIPSSILIHSTLSPILSELGSQTEAGHTYYAIKFRPDGRLAKQLDSDKNYLTLALSSDGSSPKPKNYYTLQIHSMTGTTATYRP